MHDGRLCCRSRHDTYYENKGAFKCTGAVYIPANNHNFYVDTYGQVGWENNTETTCGHYGTTNVLRFFPIGGKPNGENKKFEGVTTKGDADMVYILEVDQASATHWVHFFDTNDWKIVHSVEIADIPLNTSKSNHWGAGGITWVPDGTKEGRFLIGSHNDGKIYAYKIGKDRTQKDGILIDSFYLENTFDSDEPVYDLSDLSYEFNDKKLWSLWHDGFWGFYVHEINEAGVPGEFFSKKAALANKVGGSPPYLHEGLAVQHIEGGLSNKIWIGDEHRTIYQISWSYEDTGFHECNWVQERIIGCCYSDGPCQEVSERTCRATGGSMVGKSCEVETCNKSPYYSQGCPLDTYYQQDEENCVPCFKNSVTPRGDSPGCHECTFDVENDPHPMCSSCKVGYYNYDSDCFACDENSFDEVVSGIATCQECHYNKKVICEKCENGVVENGLCVACKDESRGIPQCSDCTIDGSQLTCTGCFQGYYFQDGICKKCSDVISGCTDCELDDSKMLICLDCDSFLRDNGCVDECEYGQHNRYQSYVAETYYRDICVDCETDNWGNDCYEYNLNKDNEEPDDDIDGGDDSSKIKADHDDESSTANLIGLWVVLALVGVLAIVAIVTKIYMVRTMTSWFDLKLKAKMKLHI
ncbi:hypothetical protein M0813_03429 [Anaeramoeba flamelloides]|uniref:Uncharacterized protein n=1 Tax=Anaeramoeba flamelloides TaxID=1746091 RepID=A0ABQ8XWN1_9EUKA|nr:hypothetical protein M0813_03429 [Anaeramoeba flamelloides]